jgi:hypothetical protein
MMTPTFGGEPDFDPDIREDAEPPQPGRDAVVDEAKKVLREFFGERATAVFYQRQLQVIFERRFFHWITAHALSELAAEQYIASDSLPLLGTGSIIVYRAKSHRYWRRQAGQIVDLVAQFSDQSFTNALGTHGELMFDAALPTVGFIPTARKVRGYKEKQWTETGHDLDRIFERDGIAYGAEVKNTLSYIDRVEFDIKTRMCKHLGLRPLFIVRMAPKNYINEIWQEGGYTLVFKYQLYPHGQKSFADKVKECLQLPVDCPARIEEGTVQRFLKWHVQNVKKRDI